MPRTTQIWIGVIILAGLGGAVYWAYNKDKAVGKPTTATIDVPDFKVPDDVDKISITNGDKGEVVLEKQGDKWGVTKPVKAPANQDNVKSLVGNLKEVKLKDGVAATLTDDDRKDYQLDAAHAVHVVAWKGADKKGDVLFGKYGGRGQVVALEGKPAAYTATGYSSYLYQRDVKAWRDTEIFKYDDATANQVTLENKNGAFSFTKADDKWAGTFKKEPIPRFDPERVKDLVRTFKSLTADDFGDGKTDTGLDAPEATLTISLKDGAGKYTLKLGKTSVASSRYAMKEGDPTVFVVTGAIADWITAPLDKFQQPADAGAKDSGSGPKPMEMPGMPPGLGGMPHGMPPGHP